MKSILLKTVLLYRKFRMWGLKGAVEFLLRQGRDRRQRLFFLRNARNHPHSEPETGITIVGDMRSFESLSKVLRDFALSLKDAGIPFQTFDTGTGSVPASDTEGILTPIPDFHIRRFSHVVEMITSQLPGGIVDHRARIVFWEFNEGVGEGYPSLIERDDPIVAMSDFNYEYFKRTFHPRCEVFKIPYPLRIDVSDIAPKNVCRAKYGFGLEDFVVFYNFSYSSGWRRKNSLGVVRAFAKAFRAVPKTKLVLKTSAIDSSWNREAELLAVAEEEGVRNQLVLFNDRMPQRNLYELTNVCDIYLSLHRAEGFGLGIAEAMCLAKAVIATDYSATTEFCKPEHSIPVPYRLVEVDEAEKESMPPTHWVRQWAEPDIDAAVDALKQLYNDPSLRLQLGLAAQRFISETYSVDRFRDAVQAFLNHRENFFAKSVTFP